MEGSQKLHFSIEGEFITKFAREKLFAEKDLDAAICILRSALESDNLDSDEQLMLCLHILHGSASIVGNTGDESYGVVTRDDLDSRPTNLSSIGTLISGMATELKLLKKENSDLHHKISYLAGEISDYELQNINKSYYEDTGEPMFYGMDASISANQPDNNVMDERLGSFLEQRRRENEAMKNNGELECDYGWLEPNGTWHPVKWGEHARWAHDWLEEHMPYDKNPKMYWRKDENGDRRSIVNGDVLVYSLNWILLDSPWQGLARVVRNPAREMTRAQKEFLYDYYIKRNRHEEAGALYKE